MPILRYACSHSIRHVCICVDASVSIVHNPHAHAQVKLQRVTLEKERLEEEARRQNADLARLRGVLLQAPPTLSPVADNFFD